MIKKYILASGLSLVLSVTIITSVTQAPQPTIEEVGALVEELPVKQAFTEYVVEPGDSLSAIAARHGIDTASLAYANGLNISSTLRIGRSLIVPRESGAIHTVKRGDTLWDVAKAYGASVTAIMEANPHIKSHALRLNEKVLIPGVTPRQAASLPAPKPVSTSVSTTTSAVSNNFLWPASGKITSVFGPRWGAFHAGIDLGISTGTQVKAARAGTVTFSGNAGGYGLLVKISHSGGYETRYAHNSKLLVKVGDKVSAGQVVALSGNTGQSTGPHLHFEIRRLGVAVNPMNYLR